MNELPFIPETHGAEVSLHDKVLIYSSENDTRVLLKTALELWGYTVEVSDCFETSIKIINESKPDLIIMDSFLPFESHLHSIRQIRHTDVSREIPIIVISGFSPTYYKNLSKESGVNDFLLKPLDLDLLEKNLKRYLKKHTKNLH